MHLTTINMKIQQFQSFTELSINKRKIKSQFFSQLSKIVDWKKISDIIDKNYSKGKNSAGAPAYEGLLLFKMALLQTWYGLSDYEVED